MVIYGNQGSISVAKPLFLKNKNSGNNESNNYNYLIVSKAAMEEANKNKEAVLNRFLKTEIGSKYAKNNTEIGVIVADNNVASMIIRQYYENRDSEDRIKCDIKLINGKKEDSMNSDSDNGNNKTGVNFAMAQERYRKIINTTIFARLKSFGEYKANEIWSATFDSKKSDKGKSMANRTFGTPNNDYAIANFALGDGNNYLEITLDSIPKCVYFSVCLYNIYLQSFDYSKGQVCLNHSNLQRNNSDNYVIYVVSNDGDINTSRCK